MTNSIVPFPFLISSILLTIVLAVIKLHYPTMYLPMSLYATTGLLEVWCFWFWFSEILKIYTSGVQLALAIIIMFIYYGLNIGTLLVRHFSLKKDPRYKMWCDENRYTSLIVYTLVVTMSFRASRTEFTKLADLEIFSAKLKNNQAYHPLHQISVASIFVITVITLIFSGSMANKQPTQNQLFFCSLDVLFIEIVILLVSIAEFLRPQQYLTENKKEYKNGKDSENVKIDEIYLNEESSYKIKDQSEQELESEKESNNLECQMIVEEEEGDACAAPQQMSGGGKTLRKVVCKFSKNDQQDASDQDKQHQLQLEQEQHYQQQKQSAQVVDQSLKVKSKIVFDNNRYDDCDQEEPAKNSAQKKKTVVLQQSKKKKQSEVQVGGIINFDPMVANLEQVGDTPLEEIHRLKKKKKKYQEQVKEEMEKLKKDLQQQIASEEFRKQAEQERRRIEEQERLKIQKQERQRREVEYKRIEEEKRRAEQQRKLEEEQKRRIKEEEKERKRLEKEAKEQKRREELQKYKQRKEEEARLQALAMQIMRQKEEERLMKLRLKQLKAEEEQAEKDQILREQKERQLMDIEDHLSREREFMEKLQSECRSANRMEHMYRQQEILKLSRMKKQLLQMLDLPKQGSQKNSVVKKRKGSSDSVDWTRKVLVHKEKSLGGLTNRSAAEEGQAKSVSNRSMISGRSRKSQDEIMSQKEQQILFEQEEIAARLSDPGRPLSQSNTGRVSPSKSLKTIHQEEQRIREKDEEQGKYNLPFISKLLSQAEDRANKYIAHIRGQATSLGPKESHRYKKQDEQLSETKISQITSYHHHRLIANASSPINNKSPPTSNRNFNSARSFQEVPSYPSQIHAIEEEQSVSFRNDIEQQEDYEEQEEQGLTGTEEMLKSSVERQRVMSMMTRRKNIKLSPKLVKVKNRLTDREMSSPKETPSKRKRIDNIGVSGSPRIRSIKHY